MTRVDEVGGGQRQLPPNRAEAVRYPKTFVARIQELAVNHHDDGIIYLLSAEGKQPRREYRLP